ncbi:DUF5615 family PIN-like protein [Enterovirga rhinocerotis]|uniref:Putative nuclease of predicted toxin-antitoxin system n=1 Tax=Enterovirga rhinocerotis TaxID=1339210 RepID=A0A4V3DWM7_9HYPH|nr:DUF5615 family PIN-like protein [Enterovirga rhinocerotis]TDR85439.1 putative nuclease of predicted toxin-antitoxin system [Enterovirga rhinocerotis]
MRFVVDMNLSPVWTDVLRSDGHDAVHWQDLGPRHARDEEILTRAGEDSRVILTADLDFGEAVVRGRLTAPSVVQLRCGNVDPAEVGQAVLAALREAGGALAGGAVLTIDKDRSRMRRGQQSTSSTDPSDG